MKRVSNNQHSRHGFTIIELLTVMSIIIILIGLLVPALNRVKRYSMDVKQRAQFHSIAIALDLFNAEFEGYPNSDTKDDQTPTPQNYCGAMKLAEAMVGQDLKGFNPASRFRRDGFGNAAPTPTMPYPALNYPDAATYNDNIRSRKMYLQLENANAYQIRDIYALAAINAANYPDNSVAAGFDPNTYVLCDSYNRVTNKTTGKKVGMPILYYKADSTKLKHPLPADSAVDMKTNNNNGLYIYNFLDNQALINMDLPWIANFVHPLASGGMTIEGYLIMDWPKKFYNITRDTKISTGDRPVRADSYILMSAGFDGEYGTKDDIYNFSD
jgi:type II secretory pathway pseudopilin PulG